MGDPTRTTSTDNKNISTESCSDLAEGMTLKLSSWNGRYKRLKWTASSLYNAYKRKQNVLVT
jgi:hypothetical protein